MKVTTKVELDGNFFRRDPGKTLRQNVRDMNDAIAAWMEAEVKAEIAGHAGDMPSYSGWSRDRTVGRTSSNSGNRWGTWAVVSANTAGMGRNDAIRTKAAAASIERRWHPYRRVKSGVYRSRPLITANLTKNLE
jgi:hypothetical protein